MFFPPQQRMTRRHMLCQIGGGFGALGLATMLAGDGLLRADEAAKASSPLAPKPPMFKARAKRVIFLFMNGGPSQVDTFDPKPALDKYKGQRPKAPPCRPTAPRAAACCRRRSRSASRARAASRSASCFPTSAR